VFARFINKAKSAASGVVSKYFARASVGIPFVIAAAFALAAIVVMQVELYGSSRPTGPWLAALPPSA
jgi:hypothetical protein